MSLRTASIKLAVTPDQAKRLADLQIAFADACNLLVPYVCEHRVWNRVALHNLTYDRLRRQTPLGSQMCCNAIWSVCQVYRSQKKRGRIRKDQPVPRLHFDRASVHFDKRTYTLAGETLSLYTLQGRIRVGMRLGEHQRRLLDRGTPKEAELVCRKGQWYFNLVVELEDSDPVTDGQVVGVDVGENNLAATSTGKVFGGGPLRHHQDKHLALIRRLQKAKSNGSRSAAQKLRQVSDKGGRRNAHVNHQISKAIVEEATGTRTSVIVLEDLTHIRDRIKAGKRVRARLHRWPFRQLQKQIEYKAAAVGIRVIYVDPAYTSRTCSECGCLGRRVKHLFECACGFRAHADCNAGRNLARIGGSTLPPRAAVNTPDVPMGSHTIH